MWFDAGHTKLQPNNLSRNRANTTKPSDSVESDTKAHSHNFYTRTIHANDSL